MVVGLSLNARLFAVLGWIIAARLTPVSPWEFVALVWVSWLLLWLIAPQWPEAGIRWSRQDGFKAFAHGFRPWRLTRRGWA